jgi:hypothetical protein
MTHTLHVVASGAMLGILLTGVPSYFRLIRFLWKEITREENC